MPVVGASAPTGNRISQAEKDALDHAECRSCGAVIYWVTMPSGRKMPLDRGRQVRVGYVEDQGFVALGTYVPHWATCPNAREHRHG